MDFNVKLQELRKQKGLTQEQLATALYVSRTAISKWESGRGYPNIDSLKGIAKIFEISIDELLSSDELLNIAEQDTKQKENHIRNLAFGLLDISAGMLFFLPFFAQKTDSMIQETSLFLLSGVSSYLKFAYFVAIFAIVLSGILTLALQNNNCKFWLLFKEKLSLILNVIGAVLFIISLQPYAAIFLFIFFVIKVLMITKK